MNKKSEGYPWWKWVNYLIIPIIGVISFIILSSITFPNCSPLVEIFTKSVLIFTFLYIGSVLLYRENIKRLKLSD